jgi:hypothetical protein
VIEYDLQMGQLTREPRHDAQLIARGLDGGHEAVTGHQPEALHHSGLRDERRVILGALHQSRRKPHPDAPHEGNLAQPLDEVAEAVRRGVAEADDPGYEPALLVLSLHPLRRRNGIRGAGV